MSRKSNLNQCSQVGVAGAAYIDMTDNNAYSSGPSFPSGLDGLSFRAKCGNKIFIVILVLHSINT